MVCLGWQILARQNMIFSKLQLEYVPTSCWKYIKLIYAPELASGHNILWICQHSVKSKRRTLPTLIVAIVLLKQSLLSSIHRNTVNELDGVHITVFNFARSLFYFFFPPGWFTEVISF